MFKNRLTFIIISLYIFLYTKKYKYMNTQKNVFLFGTNLPTWFNDLFKPTEKIGVQSFSFSNGASAIIATKNYIKGILSFGSITPESILVFDLSKNREAEIRYVLKKVMPALKRLFHSNWYAFRKRIVLLLPEGTKLFPQINNYGLAAYTGQDGLEDYAYLMGVYPQTQK